ncbi:hypothetical protein JYU34_004441 [Plutella xylostella]|uniref:FLYWCH-type domain-containing protein n=1 Tax=Plutella xylostella TaxID=51655 RepID=A0ABQ7QY23_PLUXY|nr:hypothetical protein JYU34_004441 [Plutella xylostella]
MDFKSLSRMKKRWTCSKWPQGCRQTVFTVENMQFVTSSRTGRPHMIFGSDKFTLFLDPRARADPAKRRWRCTRWSRGCRATVISVNNTVPSIVIGSHRFCIQNVKRSTQRLVRWVCTKRTSQQCRAALHTVDNAVVRIINQHNHG